MTTSSARISGVTLSGRSRRVNPVALYSAEEGGVVGCPERGDEGCEFPDKPLHLTIRHLQEDMDAAIHAMNGSGY